MSAGNAGYPPAMPPEISAEACAAPKAFTVGYYLDRIGGYSRPRTTHGLQTSVTA
jgi:hypothetical protein